mgnify:CR=1 FL=1
MSLDPSERERQAARRRQKARTAAGLDQIVEGLQDIDWARVDGMEAAEAAQITTRLEAARRATDPGEGST